MAAYRGGYDRNAGYYGGSGRNLSPRGGGRGGYGERPWTGGYRRGYQGGSGGIPTGPTPRGGGYGGRDSWWTGGPDRGRETSSYDRAYLEFHERSHPRYSPVGGNYHAMGGSYTRGRMPRPLREDQWFSDWTRWF